MGSYGNLLKICDDLKNEVDHIYNEYGVEIKLLCYKEEKLSIIGKSKEYIANELKEKVMSLLNIIHYYPEPYKDDSRLLNLFGFEFKKIKDLANYFKALSPIICGEYKFFFKAFELFDDSINEICFDIVDRLFLETRRLDMYYSDDKNNNLETNNKSKLLSEINLKLIDIYDTNGNNISKVKERIKK